MLTIEKLKTMRPGGRMIVCTEPLYQTSDGSIVGADHPDRRWKYCGIGQEVQASVWEAYKAGSQDAAEAKPKKDKGGKSGKTKKDKGGKGKPAKAEKPNAAAPEKPAEQEAKVNQQAETKEATPETKEAKPAAKAARTRKKRPREGQQE